MQENYKEMKKRHQNEFNAFPLKAAFTDKRFDTMMREWGFNSNETDKIIDIGYGCFIRKSDKGAFCEMVDRQANEMEAAMKNNEFFKSAVLYEMCNHEYAVNMQADWDVITALGFKVEYSGGRELEMCSEMTVDQKTAYLDARKEYFELEAIL